MIVCNNCRTENTDGTKFCRECGTPLGSAPAPLTQPRSTTLSTAPINTLYDLIRNLLARLGVQPSSMPAIPPTAANIRESLAKLGLFRAYYVK